MKNKWQRKLTKYMERRSINQVELSSILGVNVQTLNRWVKGHNIPTLVWRKNLEKMFKKKLTNINQEERNRVSSNNPTEG